MDEFLVTIAKDWPMMGALLVVLIGVYRLIGRMIDVASLHFEKAIRSMEKIADEIRRRDEDRGS